MLYGLLYDIIMSAPNPCTTIYEIYSGASESGTLCINVMYTNNGHCSSGLCTSPGTYTRAVVSHPSTMDGLRRRAVLSFRRSRPLYRHYAAVTAALMLCCCAWSVDPAGNPHCPVDACSTFQCPPRDRPACPLGLVPDGCACCPYGVCGLGEAVECDAAHKPCADGLECVPHVQKMVIRRPGRQRVNIYI